eukprot:Polyplicarium_translucidae@DN3571_c0_g1_i1.p2
MQFSRAFGFAGVVGVAFTSRFARDQVEVPKEAEQSGAEEVGCHAGDATAGSSPGTNEQWKCVSCSKLYASKNSLANHQRREHSERRLECGKCDKRFAVEWLLKLHKQKHEEPQFRCTRCERKFRVKSNLNVHMDIH